jgi:cell fate regulator YaaT (PSP1 superfamily)
MEKIVGIKFKNTSKVYYFAPEHPNAVYEVGQGVIVETAKGLEYGNVVFGVKEVDDDDVVKPLKPVVRKTTKKDDDLIRENEKKIPNAIKIAEEKVLKNNLDMKIVGAEYSYDGKKIIFYFTADCRIDFRELVKDLAQAFKIRIELRQIGIRDETKLIGGLGPCGRECCCSSCVPDFKKVSIKMAKNQGLSLNPTKISGLCGRLMCCLEYENGYYAEVCKKMPKQGGQVSTPEGNGVVISNNMLKLLVKVKITKGDGSEIYKDFALKDIRFNKSQNDVKDDDENLEELKELLD